MTHRALILTTSTSEGSGASRASRASNSTLNTIARIIRIVKIFVKSRVKSRACSCGFYTGVVDHNKLYDFAAPHPKFIPKCIRAYSSLDFRWAFEFFQRICILINQ